MTNTHEMQETPENIGSSNAARLVIRRIESAITLLDGAWGHLLRFPFDDASISEIEAISDAADSLQSYVARMRGAIAAVESYMLDDISRRAGADAARAALGVADGRE